MKACIVSNIACVMRSRNINLISKIKKKIRTSTYGSMLFLHSSSKLQNTLLNKYNSIIEILSYSRLQYVL